MSTVIYVQSLLDTAAVWIGFVGTTVFLILYTVLGFVGPEDVRLKWWKSHAGRAIIMLDIGMWCIFAPVCWLLISHEEPKAAILAVLDNLVSSYVAFNWFILIGLVIAAVVPCYRAGCLSVRYYKRRQRYSQGHKVSPPNQS